MVKWTKEQEKAIYTKGSDVLVAAAAGSGKTAVLVERIIQKLLDKQDPVDIDSLLVVTFTNAAAQEMRNRVGVALEKALVGDPSSIHLKRQLSLLQRASISTLHSFCLDIVKRYAYLLDIDPNFRIADNMEADLMQQEVIDDLFEEWYGKEGEEQDRFFAVVDRFSSDRSDIDVEQLILKIYTFSIQNPWPDVWLDQVSDAYMLQEDWEEQDLPWLDLIKREIVDQFSAMQQEMDVAMKLARENDGPFQYVDTIEEDMKLLKDARANLHSWDDLQTFMAKSKFGRLSGKRTECNEDKKKRVQAIRNSYKDRWGKLASTYFMRNLAGHVQDMRELAPVIKQLTELVKEFRNRFTKLKTEKAVVDFSDLEHYCLRLLMDEQSTNEKILPSSVAKQMQNQFTEVLVDEYQDTNLVQETILQLVSNQEEYGNMFMVGDVKQSIYRFRHAEPSLFIEKYKHFAMQEDPGVRIDLARNFRSREQVLVGANYIFRQILDEKLGEINYDTDAELIYANKMYDTLPYADENPELIIIDREQTDTHEENEDEDENYLDLEKAQLEARAYAQKIKQWIGTDETASMQVVDADTKVQRSIRYRDIVILLRSMSWAPVIVDELKQQGIPVYAELSTGYFDAIEVKVMISYLKTIDNPRQDIPLASVLKSPIVGLNEDELAKIRLADPKHSYYDALKKYVATTNNDTAERISTFLEAVKRYRIAARQGALSDLIWQIYRESGYYDYVGGIPGGRQRQANLRALFDRARGYETTSFRGLFRFLRFIERMEERGDDLGAAKALSEQEDVVRIMTIHKSKGLEFPVVIVGALDKQFNLQDLNKRYLLHKDLGFASHYIDPVKRITYPTLYFQALKSEALREQLAEEMRVLYVALTRAKEKLVMISNVNSFEKKITKWQTMVEHAEWVLPAHFRGESKTYLDWVGPALIRHEAAEALRTEELSDTVLDEIRVDPSKWTITIMHGSELTNIADESKEKDEKLKDNLEKWQQVKVDSEELASYVEHRLQFQYGYEQATHSRAKQTVTEIKRQQEMKDAYSSDQMVHHDWTPIVRRPNFMQKEKTFSAAEKGTALHTVMQHIPFQKQWTMNEIKEFTQSLVDREILRQEAADVIDAEAIASFFKSDIALYMMEVDKLYREVPFSLTLQAKDIYANWEGEQSEQVLIQGVLDCVVPTENGWIIVDYKTDTIRGEVSDDMIIKLKQRYEVQMNLYRHAIEEIWQQPVTDVYLYFFDKQLLVKVEK